MGGSLRSVGNKDLFTPFGIWVREYCRPSDTGLSVTNVDFFFEDFRNKRSLFLEEKQSGGILHYAQRLSFAVMDAAMAHPNSGYDHWGFFVLTMPYGRTMPGPGMMLNDAPITCEQLIQHLNFEKKFCTGLVLGRAPSRSS